MWSPTSRTGKLDGTGRYGGGLARCSECVGKPYVSRSTLTARSTTRASLSLSASTAWQSKRIGHRAVGGEHGTGLFQMRDGKVTRFVAYFSTASAHEPTSASRSRQCRRRTWRRCATVISTPSTYSPAYRPSRLSSGTATSKGGTPALREWDGIPGEPWHPAPLPLRARTSSANGHPHVHKQTGRSAVYWSERTCAVFGSTRPSSTSR